MDSPRVRVESIGLSSLGDYFRLNRLPSVERPRTKGSLEKKPILPKPLQADGLLTPAQKQTVQLIKDVRKQPVVEVPPPKKKNKKKHKEPSVSVSDSGSEQKPQLAQSDTSRDDQDVVVKQAEPKRKVATRARFVQTDEVRFRTDQDDEREQELTNQIDDLTNERNTLQNTVSDYENKLEKTSEKNNKASMQLVLMMIEMLRQDYLRLHPEDDVKGLPEQELRARLRKANTDINRLTIEADELKRSLRHNRDFNKEELAEQNEQLKQEISALERRIALGLGPYGKKPRSDKENREPSSSPLRRKGYTLDNELADIKKENARLKKDIVALAKDRESIVSKMMIEQERFRLLLKEEAEKYLDKKKELRDAKGVRAGMAKQLEDLAATVIQLRQKTEIWSDYEQIKAERDQLRKLFAEKQFDLSWVQGNSGTVNLQDQIDQLQQENNMLKNGLLQYEHTGEYGNMPTSGRMLHSYNKPLETQKTDACMIHNFLLSVENLRLMSMMRQFVVDNRAKKVESGVASIQDRDDKLDPRFELDFLRQENGRLKMIIESLEHRRPDVNLTRGNVGTPTRASQQHSKWDEGDTTNRTSRTGQGSHSHHGYSCEESLRIMRVENKRLNEALAQSIREVEQLKRRG